MAHLLFHTAKKKTEQIWNKINELTKEKESNELGQEVH